MADSAGHDQAIVREVQVTVQGAKHVEGTEQRQIFTETTKTTIVFGNGAVVNLNSKVVQGQCVFLRNDQTGREILCKVLEWRQVAESGYVDLEFTTRDPHFWDAPVAQPEAAAPNPEPQKATEATPRTPAPEPKAVANLSAREELVAAHEVVVAPVETATSAEPASATAGSSEAEAQAAVPAPDDGADWDEAQDEALLKALMATDPKRKPKREAADEQATSEDAPEQREASAGGEGDREREVELGAAAVSTRASWIRGLHKYTYGKNARNVGIAASVLLVATLGFVWHAKHRAAIRNKNQAAAAVAQAKQNAVNAAPSSPTPASAVATGAPATANMTSTNSGAGTATNTANAGTISGNSSATPAQAAQKIQQQTGAPNAGVAIANNSTAPAIMSAATSAASKLEASERAPDGDQEALGQVKHHHAKGPKGGETIPARIVAQPPPAIPPWAKGLDTDGVVKLDALIDEKGNVRETKALSGPRLLQHEAERAVALWIFEPALTDGKPTATHMVLTVQFQR
jgi:hypothetical protein